MSEEEAVRLAREQLEIAERLEQLEEDLGHKGGSSRRGA
jgi:hypothetical protein